MRPQGWDIVYSSLSLFLCVHISPDACYWDIRVKMHTGWGFCGSPRTTAEWGHKADSGTDTRLHTHLHTHLHSACCDWSHELYVIYWMVETGYQVLWTARGDDLLKRKRAKAFLLCAVHEYQYRGTMYWRWGTPWNHHIRCECCRTQQDTIAECWTV